MEKRRNKIIKIHLILPVLLLCNLTFGGTPITISFEQIEFETGHILTLGDGTSNNTDLSEYFAFYIDDYRNSYVDLTISSNCSDPVTLIINASQSGSGLGNMCKVLYNYTISSVTPITLNFSGAVPSSISKYDYNWNWTITAIPCNTSAYDANTITNSTHHCCYVLYDEPQAPMDEPWIDVLDYACSWASGGTNSSTIIQSLTSNLYSCGVLYDGGQHYTSGYTDLNLTLLLSNLSSPNNVEMDCRDFSNFLQVLSNSLGVECQYNRVDMHCNYNYLFPAGYSVPIGPGYWNYHQIGWYNSEVADAATQIDNDADPTSSPHTWKLAVGDMTLSSYLDKLTETSVSSVATGTCTIH